MADNPDSAHLSALMSAAVDAIVLADAKGRILRCNRATEALFGYDTGELEGQTLNILMPDSEAQRHDGYMTRHMETGEERIIGHGRELEGRRKDGSIFPLHLSVGRSETPQGTFFVGLLHDLTRRRAAELAVERSQRLEAVGQMTGGIAHDFNNVLTLIIGNLELVSHRDVAPDVRGLIADALDAAELGAELTARLLAFARQSRLEPERIDVNALVSRTSTMTRHALPQGIRIDLAPEPAPWAVHADPAELQSALVNLLRNSQDAIGEEGVILISTDNVTIDDAYLAQEIDVAPGNYVRITVSDTGKGLTDEAKRRAFEPFFTTKPPGKGTGLGLATVYGFVRQSGGHVTIYSEPGQGTTIGLYLPALDAEVSTATLAETPREALLPGRGETILVVEDDAGLRRLTSTRIGALGFSVIQAATAEEALAHLDSGTPVSLVFSDVMMPGGLTGVQLARKLRDIRPDLPVLLTTGYAGEMTDAELVDGFPMIRKPYRQEDLARALHRAMARARAR